MAEWSIAAVLKTAEPKGSVGSNPTFSAKFAEGEFKLFSVGCRTCSTAQREALLLGRSPNSQSPGAARDNPTA